MRFHYSSSSSSTCQVLVLISSISIASSRISGFLNKAVFDQEREKTPQFKPIFHFPDTFRTARLIDPEDEFIPQREVVPFFTKENFPYLEEEAVQPPEEEGARPLKGEKGEQDSTPEFEFPTHLFTSPEAAYREAEAKGDFSSPKETHQVRTTFSFNGPIFRGDFSSPLDDGDHFLNLDEVAPSQVREREVLESQRGEGDPLFQSASHLSPMIALASLGGFEGELGGMGKPRKEERYLKSFRPFK